MKNYLTFFIFILILTFATSSYANVEMGKWNFIKEVDYCFIGSAPVETDLPESKQRGITYILVYRINKSKDAIVQIAAGYPYKKDQNVDVTIGNVQFDFYSDDDTAWSNDDNKVIFAMKKGIKLTVKGESSRGTKTTDIYTLKGFTAAYNQLFNDC
ncbi:MAG: hypothetical protein CFH13_00887 [Alphaproteobacteria bacterium MarineAlpha5_Bin3]|jgi:hypothetical protein|nr:MAG: hypothetical protein CFH13_00887 [Alphaproteobacteria bacterium MarineAlpha5_Bin3]